MENYLRDSQALEDYWQRPITAEQLQAEMDRMAQHTRQPEVLHELFDALGNDPFVIAECLARPALAERLVTDLYTHEQRFHGELKMASRNHRRASAENQILEYHMTAASASYTLPTISDRPTDALMTHGQPPARPTRPAPDTVTRQSGLALK